MPGGSRSSHDLSASNRQLSVTSSPLRDTTASASSGSLAAKYSSIALSGSPACSTAAAVLQLQGAERLRSLLLHVLLPKVVPEEVVIAVRAACVVDEREHVVGDETFEQTLRVVCAGDLTASSAVIESRQHVRARNAVVSASSRRNASSERYEKTSLVSRGSPRRVLDRAEVGPLEGAADEDEAGRPAFREIEESLGLISRLNTDPSWCRHLGDLPGVESQVFEGDLSHLVVELEPGRGHGRAEAREQRDVDVAGQVGKQVVETLVELGSTTAWW